MLSRNRAGSSTGFLLLFTLFQCADNEDNVDDDDNDKYDDNDDDVMI